MDVVWDFIKNIFGKVLVFIFGICFLRTFQDFYSYRPIEYVIGYIGRGFLYIYIFYGILYEEGFLECLLYGILLHLWKFKTPTLSKLYFSII